MPRLRLLQFLGLAAIGALYLGGSPTPSYAAQSGHCWVGNGACLDTVLDPGGGSHGEYSGPGYFCGYLSLGWCTTCCSSPEDICSHGEIALPFMAEDWGQC